MVRSVLVDTSAWFALINRRDAYRARARRARRGDR